MIDDREWQFRNKIRVPLWEDRNGSQRLTMKNLEYTLVSAVWAKPIGQQSCYPVVTTI